MARDFMRAMAGKSGRNLTWPEQRYVLAKYVHRYTGEHKPTWAQSGTWRDGQPYPVQFRDDRDWLAHTYFAVNDDGTLDRRAGECFSSPTWPHNPELRKAVTAVPQRGD